MSQITFTKIVQTLKIFITNNKKKFIQIEWSNS